MTLATSFATRTKKSLQTKLVLRGPVDISTNYPHDCDGSISGPTPESHFALKMGKITLMVDDNTYRTV